MLKKWLVMRFQKYFTKLNLNLNFQNTGEKSVQHLNKRPLDGWPVKKWDSCVFPRGLFEALYDTSLASICPADVLNLKLSTTLALCYRWGTWRPRWQVFDDPHRVRLETDFLKFGFSCSTSHIITTRRPYLIMIKTTQPQCQHNHITTLSSQPHNTMSIFNDSSAITTLKNN